MFLSTNRGGLDERREGICVQIGLDSTNNARREMGLQEINAIGTPREKPTIASTSGSYVFVPKSLSK